MKELMDKRNETICKKKKLMGANVVLFNSEHIVYHYNYGYANKEQGMKSTNDSLYMIGSNTKVMTAICILKLMEEGKLSLEDDIRKFIPEFEVKSTFSYDKITIGNLLMHRSGLVGDFFQLIIDPTEDFHHVIGEIKNSYLTAVPGTMFAYSNVGYTVLGVIIERVSGYTYEEFINRSIAEPLGIKIHFLQIKEQRDAFSKEISLCYNRKGKAVEDLLCTMLPAGSNTYMSISDFVKFGQIFLKKDGTVLKRETLMLMETLDCTNPMDLELCNGGYGLLHNMYNFGDAVGKIYGHGGDTMYHHSFFYYIPSQNIGIAVFTNSEQAPTVIGELANKTMISYLNKKGIETETYTNVYHYTQEDGEKYQGKYVTPLGVCDVTKNQKGELTTKIKGLSIKLKPCEDGFWHLCPNHVLLYFPPIKKELRNLRIKFVRYESKDILVMEEREENNRVLGIVGSRYEKSRISDTFKRACGKYEIVNDGLKDKKGSCFLHIKNDTLTLELCMLGIKGSICLKVIDESLALVQGFGRSTGNDVSLREEQGELYFTWCGLTFQKVKK